ncbi:hypothetical protein B5P22_31040 [Pseudomonas tolaasii]|nr:hypothetical protein B5P22_31040 [Pseudomonas tolaasii]
MLLDQPTNKQEKSTMALKVIYARIKEDGTLRSENHGSCFGYISTLYHDIPKASSYDRRILVSTNFNGKCARLWADGFRKSYAKGMTFKRDQDLVTTELPKIKYYGLDHKSVGINKDMNELMRKNGSAGYWQLTIPATVTEYEMYVFVKLFCKIGSMPSVSTQALEGALLPLVANTDDWRKVLLGMGQMGMSGGYNFPVGPGGNYLKAALKGWLCGEHIILSQGAAGRQTFFGSPCTSTHRNIGTGVQVMPSLYSYTDNAGTIHLSSSRSVTAIIRDIERILE